MSPLHLGSVTLDFPVVQAALSGYSDWAMRSIARRMGAPYTLCEVMLDQFLVALKKRQKTSHILHLSDDERPVGGQLMGAEPEQFSAGAVKLVEAGFDVIDINFGCPVKKVLGRCRGGFHLSQPDTALEIVRRTRDVVPPDRPVTVKMRRGVDDSNESRDRFFEIAEGAFAAGIAAITVHGRTVEQRYIGPSKWQFLAELKKHFPDRTILGSGDLFQAEDCVRMMRETGVDGVTVARGAIGNPWIFGQARALAAGLPLPDPPSLFEQRDVLDEHLRRSEQLYGETKACRMMRKFFVRYAALHPAYLEVRNTFVQVKTREQFRAVLEQFYGEDLPGCHPDPAIHHVQGSGASSASAN